METGAKGISGLERQRVSTPPILLEGIPVTPPDIHYSIASCLDNAHRIRASHWYPIAIVPNRISGQACFRVPTSALRPPTSRPFQPLPPGIPACISAEGSSARAPTELWGGAAATALPGWKPYRVYGVEYDTGSGRLPLWFVLRAASSVDTSERATSVHGSSNDVNQEKESETV